VKKNEQMTLLIDLITNCQRCRLWQEATNSVPGEGSLKARLMLIGEAPGYWEDMKGRPFVGAAGRMLTDLLNQINLSREQIFIGNIVKHRPPSNRAPRVDEVAACAPYLDKQILIINPQIIVTLGRHATKYLLSKGDIKMDRISQIRGQIFTITLGDSSFHVMPTFHPAALLYNASYKPEIQQDFLKIQRLLAQWAVAEDKPIEGT
jgi:uracil-DNA glycosylase family 4